MEKIERKEAAKVGLKKYFTGLPCKQGHISPRYVSTGGCETCLNPLKTNSQTKTSSSNRNELTLAHIALQREKLAAKLEMERMKTDRLTARELKRLQLRRMIVLGVGNRYETYDEIIDFAWALALLVEPTISRPQIVAGIKNGMQMVRAFPQHIESVMALAKRIGYIKPSIELGPLPKSDPEPEPEIGWDASKGYFR